MKDSSTVGLLAATFKNLKAYSDATNGLHWREAAAKSLEDVAAAIEAGMERRAVVLVCRGAAKAFREPGHLAKIRKETEQEVEGTWTHKKGQSQEGGET